MNLRARVHEREGVALILALVFVVLLAVIVTEFTYGMQVDAILISQESTETEAILAGRSAIALSMSVLAADLIIGEEEASAQQTGVYDSLDEPWASGTPVVDYNDAMVAIQITDEYGKINLNALIYEDSGGQEVEFEPLVAAVRYIFEQRSEDADPTDAILDWLDADDEPRPDGFERDYYEELSPPIAIKNGPMDSLEELLLIPGVSQELYFAEFEEELDPPLLAFDDVFTVHGHPEGRVNVNTATTDVLEAMFAGASETMGTSGSADQILQRREEVGPFMSREELRSEGLLPPKRDPNAPGQEGQGEQQGEEVPPPGPELFDVKSSVFLIKGEAKMGDVSVSVQAYVWRDTPQEDAAGQQSASGAAQICRIIDWRLQS